MANITNDRSAVKPREPESYRIEKSLLEMASLQELGSFLKERREVSGHSPKDIYQKIQLDDSSLSRMETGQRMPSKTMCEKIAEHYNLPRYLFLYVVRTLVKNDQEGTSQPRTALAHYLQLSKELSDDLIKGKISIETADQIVSSWEGIITAIKDMKAAKEESVEEEKMVPS